MEIHNCPVLKGNVLFRNGESVYINKSDDLTEYMGLVHKHDFIEIAYVISGNGKHIFGEKEYEISRGDLFVINYDVPHGFFPLEKGKDEPVVYNCVFMPRFLDASLFSSIHFQDIASSFLFKSLFPEESAAVPDLKLHGADFYDIGELFAKMHREYKDMKKGYSDIIRAYLIELVVKIFRHSESDGRKEASPKNSELVNTAIKYMKTNFNTEIKLEDIAMKSFISKNYFSRLFKDVTGTSFSDYIQKLRVEEACRLLKTSDMKVTDVALQSGFNDLKFFYEVFKKLTGKTPGEFRKS